MKSVSLRGLLISVLALLSIGQGIQAKSTPAELAEAREELDKARKDFNKCVIGCAHKKVCIGTRCAPEKLLLNRMEREVRRLESPELEKLERPEKKVTRE